MKTKGKKYLLFASVLSILMGIGSFATMWWILQQDPGQYTIYGNDVTSLAKDALWTLVIIYAIAGFQIIAGIIGIVLSNSIEKAKFCQFIGLILIFAQSVSISHGHGTLELTYIITYVILMISPVYYFYGATLNCKQKEQ